MGWISYSLVVVNGPSNPPPFLVAQGFDGSKFDWHGTPGQWATVIFSDAQAFGVAMRVRVTVTVERRRGCVQPQCENKVPDSTLRNLQISWPTFQPRAAQPRQVEKGPYPGTTLARAMAFRSGTTVVGTELVQAGRAGAWVIQAKANKVAMEAGVPVTLPGGIVATLTQGNPGPVSPRYGTLIITGGALGWRLVQAQPVHAGWCKQVGGSGTLRSATPASSHPSFTPPASSRLWPGDCRPAVPRRHPADDGILQHCHPAEQAAGPAGARPPGAQLLCSAGQGERTASGGSRGRWIRQHHLQRLHERRQLMSGAGRPYVDQLLTDVSAT